MSPFETYTAIESSIPLLNETELDALYDYIRADISSTATRDPYLDLLGGTHELAR